MYIIFPNCFSKLLINETDNGVFGYLFSLINQTVNSVFGSLFSLIKQTVNGVFGYLFSLINQTVNGVFGYLFLLINQTVNGVFVYLSPYQLRSGQNKQKLVCAKKIVITNASIQNCRQVK